MAVGLKFAIVARAVAAMVDAAWDGVAKGDDTGSVAAWKFAATNSCSYGCN